MHPNLVIVNTEQGESFRNDLRFKYSEYNAPIFNFKLPRPLSH